MMKKLIVLSFAVIGIFALFIAAGVADQGGGLQVGDTAPDFKLKGTDGEYHSLATLKDANGKDPKGYIVTFTCNTCPWAVKYEDRLIELHKEMSAQGYPLVAIQPNDPDQKPGDSFDAMKKRAADKGFPFLYLFDEEQEVFPVYGATRTPEIYLLDNKLKLHYTGAVDDNPHDAAAVKVNYVKAAIKAMENGKKPDPEKVKAIGCTIKAKQT